MSAIPLIYVLSNGSSGSTLLDMLLGTHPDLWSLGEAQLLPWDLHTAPKPCGCHTAIDDCAFWKPILTQIPLHEGDFPIEYFRRHRRVLQWRLIPDLPRGKISRSRKEIVAEYGKLNARYFEAVRRQAAEFRGHPVRWLVDASKDPYRLMWLQASGLFDIRVIHLVKDPRAYVYSMTKHARSVSFRRQLRYVGRWNVQNMIFLLLRRRFFARGQTMLLTYEDLASEPERVDSSLQQWLDVSRREESVHDFRRVVQHGISGDETRWKNSPILLDTKWRRHIPSGAASMIWGLTGPVRKGIGY